MGITDTKNRSVMKLSRSFSLLLFWKFTSPQTGVRERIFPFPFRHGVVLKRSSEVSVVTLTFSVSETGISSASRLSLRLNTSTSTTVTIKKRKRVTDESSTHKVYSLDWISLPTLTCTDCPWLWDIEIHRTGSSSMSSVGIWPSREWLGDGVDTSETGQLLSK